MGHLMSTFTKIKAKLNFEEIKQLPSEEVTLGQLHMINNNIYKYTEDGWVPYVANPIIFKLNKL